MNQPTTPVYEIYALKYAGPFRSKLAKLLWNVGWDEEIDRNYYIWAVRGNGENLVVDAGISASLARERGLEGFVSPVDVLARIGLNASTVTRVIITHMHFDHAGGTEVFVSAFPKATFYVQEKELDFWARDPMAKRPPFAALADTAAVQVLASLQGTDRLVTAKGDRTILPGIDLLLATGHTVGLQVVAVNTAKGTAILASDCAHIARSFKEDIPSCFITDMIAWMHTYDKLRATATALDLIFPGHDTAMLHNYPKVAEDVTRLV
jgi:glyoxylase-like metal-dependent hydrolase (beta-lactamase superfamily II)